MRAVLALLAVCVGLVACATATGGPSSGTSLRIAYWEDGMEAMPGTQAKPDAAWTLQCRPAGGSLARPARACAQLAAGGRALFAPLSPKVVCTEIYGGPQRARVTGMLDGKPVWATFSRSNGCHIARWAKVSPWLLPPGGVT
ncbi:MAG TPA: SSI family serine proteinase inhibitor [Gaiellaceae bacterium]|nr:SSI family serine proteinase inhibitor [Gaiellaceae bacterium]